jgi:hypothetical protein
MTEFKLTKIITMKGDPCFARTLNVYDYDKIYLQTTRND